MMNTQVTNTEDTTSLQRKPKGNCYPFMVTLNILGLLALTVPLYIAFYYQLAHHELPCPLCILQRVGLAVAGLGFLFNIYRGIHFSHYALIIISSLLTGAVAVRQIFLHILPGDLGYGTTFLGLHFYTWVFITSVVLILGVLAMIIISETVNKCVKLLPLYRSRSLVTALFTLVLLANMVSSLLECGLRECPDDPTEYLLLKK